MGESHRGWLFFIETKFVAHIAAVRDQVAEMRREQGLDPDIQSWKEHLLFLENYVAPEDPNPSPPPNFGPVFRAQTPADASRPAEARPESPTRKRTRDRVDTEPASGPAPESDKEDGSQGERGPVPKRRKPGRPSKTKPAANPPSKQPRDTKAGRKRGKTNTDAANDIETAQQAVVHGKTGKTGQKRRGRPPKTPRADPVPEALTQGKGQKSKASKERAVVKRRNATTASSATGPRRSARVAAMNQK